jgi:hypothetical protein
MRDEYVCTWHLDARKAEDLRWVEDIDDKAHVPLALPRVRDRRFAYLHIPAF